MTLVIDMTTISIARRIMKFLVDNQLQILYKERAALVHVLPETTRINFGRHTKPGPPENETEMLFIPP